MSQELRRVAARLSARNRTIPWYGLLHALGLVPRRYEVKFAAAWLYSLVHIVDKGKDLPNELRTSEWKKVMSEGVFALAQMAKDSLGVSDKVIADDITQRIRKLPPVEQIEIAQNVLPPDEFAKRGLSSDQLAELGLSPDEIAKLGLSPDKN